MNIEISNKNQYSRFIPIWKFVILSFATCGFYQLIWLYRTWKFLRDENKLKVSPLARAVFAPLYIWSLANNLQKFLHARCYSCNYSAILIGIAYIPSQFLGILPTPCWLLSSLNFLILIPLLNALNNYWESEDFGLPLKPIQLWQILLIALGILISTWLSFTLPILQKMLFASFFSIH